MVRRTDAAASESPGEAAAAGQGKASSKSPGGKGLASAKKKAARLPDFELYGRRVRVKCDFKGKISQYEGVITGWNLRIKEYK